LQISYIGFGSIPFHHHNFSLKSLLHVPKIQKNLISVNQFTRDNQVFIEFHPTCFVVKDLKSRRLLFQGPSRGGLYPWPSQLPHSSSPFALVGERVSLDQWHSRLGHPAMRVVHCVLSSYQLPVKSNKSNVFCSSCHQGKLHKFHFSVSPSVSKGPLDLLFLDVRGPAPLFSTNNKRYFLCIVDDFSRYSWTFPLNCKSDVIVTFIRFKQLVEKFFSRSIKSVQSDGGGEFIPVQKFLISNGISYRQTCPHTHHQNGSVERKLRHIVDTGLALLAHSHVPLKYWDDAFDTACYLINRLPPSVNRVKSPFELLFDKSLDFKLLKVLGVSVGRILGLITPTKCPSGLSLVFFWDIANLMLVINVFTSLQVDCILHVMLFLMKTNFLFNLTQCQCLHHVPPLLLYHLACIFLRPFPL
jgi:hypothetical protein